MSIIAKYDTTISQSQQQMCQNSSRKPHAFENKAKKKKKKLKGQELQHRLPLTLVFTFSKDDVTEKLWIWNLTNQSVDL